jgi:NTE family protein
MTKTAFVLSGGGAKGCFQVGVLKKLTEEGVVPEAIFGTSVGALNATGLSYAGMDELEKIWLNIQRNSDIIRFQVGTILFATKGLYSTKPLHEIIKSFVNGFPKNNIHPYVCMNNLYTGQVVYVDPWTSNLRGLTFDEAVLASASLPLAMEPVKNVWVDGGIRETVPMREAIRKGYDELYVVMCNPWTRNPKPTKEIKHWLCAGARTLDLLTHEIFINDVQTCLKCNDRDNKKTVKIHLYAPDELVIDTLEFDPEKIRKGIEQGYEATEISHDFVRSL